MWCIDRVKSNLLFYEIDHLFVPAPYYRLYYLHYFLLFVAPSSQIYHWHGRQPKVLPTSYKTTTCNTSLHKPQKQLHLAQRSYNSWKACSNGITIVNTHKDEHLTTNLVCKGLNGATHTCSGLRKYDDQDHQRSRVKRRLRNRNASVNLDYDILPVFAYENGLVDKS